MLSHLLSSGRGERRVVTAASPAVGKPDTCFGVDATFGRSHCSGEALVGIMILESMCWMRGTANTHGNKGLDSSGSLLMLVCVNVR